MAKADVTVEYVEQRVEGRAYSRQNTRPLSVPVDLPATRARAIRGHGVNRKSANETRALAMYRGSIPSSRTGAIYNAFSYPTKIDSEAIALYIATHTTPGQTVLDPFGGSGSTGIAARLCDSPTPRMLALAEQLGLDPQWGPRHAVIYELSTIGALLSSVMTTPPDVTRFRLAAQVVIEDARAELAWMYATRDPQGNPGELRYAIWSEVVCTPCCSVEITTWDAVATTNPASFNSNFECPGCRKNVELSSCARVHSRQFDPVSQKRIVGRRRTPVMIYGRTGNKSWARTPTSDDLRVLRRVTREPFPTEAPTGVVAWGDLHRTGYHFGITNYHQLYTRRNLIALSCLWRLIGAQPKDLQDALKLLVLSYNASHSTLMTRVVAKSGQKEFVVSGSQTGVLYVSGLPVEKNVFSGVTRKIETFVDAFSLIGKGASTVRVVNASSTDLDLANNSIDYVFTDPPFGDFIPYAEVNSINEVWLGKMTDQLNEAVISHAQGKGIEEYARLMKDVFAEVARVLKPSGAATVVFHASKPQVWKALGDCFAANALEVLASSVLDKTQVSFKQVVSEAGTRGDAVFLLRSGRTKGDQTEDDVTLDEIIQSLVETATTTTEKSAKRLYSRFVGYCVERSRPVDLSARDFYDTLQART